MQHPAQTLFQLQSELVDAKVEVSVSRAIASVVSQIVNLRLEVHQEMGAIKEEMHEMRHEMGSRLSAVETALGMRRQKQTEFRTRFIDYSFKAGWVVVFAALSGLFSYMAVHWPGIF